MPVRHREEVLNTALADTIVARGLNATPESIRDYGKEPQDVMIVFRGLRCVDNLLQEPIRLGKPPGRLAV